MNSPSRIADRLNHRKLLVTGATGLLAKVFVEKLLRSVPEIGSIRLLVRDRPDGTSGSQRLHDEILGSSVFDRLRALWGSRFPERAAAKINVVGGDLTLPRLGLDQTAYRTLTEDLDVVVNSAAAVTFDERLDLALQLNALAPTQLLQLCRDAGDIPFMQVSTCYVSGRRSGTIAETLEQPTGDHRVDLDGAIERLSEACRRIQSAGDLDDEGRRRRLVQAGMELAREYGWNDTYTFTKWLGEQLLDRERGNIPTTILRPAIIESSHEEPMPGWIEGLRMADPMIIAFGRGKLREFPADPEVAIDLIPVDLVANAMIIALPERSPAAGVQIYQVASSQRNPLKVADLAEALSSAFQRCPMIDDAGQAIHPGQFRLVDRASFFSAWQRKLNHAARYRRLLERINLAPVQRRRLATLIAQIEQIIYFAKIYSPYTHLDCRFADDRLRALAEKLDPQDRRTFPVGAELIDWNDYIANRHIPGLRRYVLGGLQGSAGRLPLEEHHPRRELTIRRIRQEHETIYTVFREVARLCAEKPALQICRGGRWIRYTYGEAVEACNAISRRLQEQGVEPGDRVVICAENGPEWGLTYLAAMRCGLTAVPLDPQQPASEALECARIAGARLICGGPAAFQSLQQAAEASGWSGTVLQMDDSLVPPPGASPDSGPAPRPGRPTDLASILFTSGTTVAPKAVPLTHRNLLANARALLKLHRLRSTERFLSVLPLYHAFEFTGGFLVPMCIGATVTYVEELKGPQILAALQASRATIMLAVPRLLKMFADGIQTQAEQAGLFTRNAFRACGRLSDLTAHQAARQLFATVHRRFGGHLRKFISGGSALDPELQRFFTRLGFEVYEGYGLTETAPVLTVNPTGGAKPGSVGVALANVDLQIRNTNSEGIGELWARGPNVMGGYLDNPDATAEVIRGGWFRTGDLARRDAEGYFYITGRVKDMVVTEAGKNVYPDEVEARYKDLPYVKEMCVLGMPGSSGIGETVHAVVIPDYDAAAGQDPSAVQRSIREAAAAIAESIPPHQRIQSLHFWSAELPKTSTLKAKRGLIRNMLLDGSGAARSRRRPTTEGRAAGMDAGLTEAQGVVRRILAQLTREPEASIHAQTHLLLDLGVDSLMKLQLIGELENHFDLRCTNEQASPLARVGDLYALVGARPVVRRRGAATPPWKAPDSTTTGRPATANGAMNLPLRTARWTARTGLSLALKSYIRVRARGAEHLPRSGPFLLAANHSSHLDAVSVLTAVANRRRVWVAGAEDYFFNTRTKGWVFGQLLDTIPFDRFSEGYEGLRRCLEKLAQGDGLLFFPEGTRSLTGEMAEFKIGAALMSIESGAVVIPTRIDHAFDLLPKGRRLARPGVVQVTFGAAIRPTPWQCPDDLTRQYQMYREMSAHLQACVRQLPAAAPRREQS